MSETIVFTIVGAGLLKHGICSLHEGVLSLHVRNLLLDSLSCQLVVEPPSLVNDPMRRKTPPGGIGQSPACWVVPLLLGCLLIIPSLLGGAPVLHHWGCKLTILETPLVKFQFGHLCRIM